jgi:hypothetical protein
LRRAQVVGVTLLLLLGACGPEDELGAAGSSLAQPSPLGGWRILSPDYDAQHPLDLISFEWDYFMIHDHARGFYGVIGYLISNPRDRLGTIVQLLPNGGNVAAIAQLRGAEPFAQYVSFGAKGYLAAADRRYLSAADAKGRHALLEPLPGGGPAGEDAMHLEGRTDQLSWDLIVTQEWTDRPGGGPRHLSGSDVGVLPGEVWNVDQLWPRTRARGTITDLRTGEVFAIDAPGYRDNAWGRYNTVLDGWDFLVGYESEADLKARQIPSDQGVGFYLQTFHKSSALDYAEVSFFDGGLPRTERFVAKLGELHWKHPSWRWDSDAWQCTPHSTTLALENTRYRIDLSASFGPKDQHPLLSDVTALVARYFIQYTFPAFKGTIVRKSDGKLVRSFAGKGVGEFSFAKSFRLWPASELECTLWGRPVFAR